MKSAFSNVSFSLLLYGANVTAVSTVAVEPVAAAHFAPRGTFNNAAVATRAAARSTASMLATERANSSAPTPAERILNQSHVNANSGLISGAGSP
jgi:hypothetical protein